MNGINKRAIAKLAGTLGLAGASSLLAFPAFSASSSLSKVNPNPTIFSEAPYNRVAQSGGSSVAPSGTPTNPSAAPAGSGGSGADVVVPSAGGSMMPSGTSTPTPAQGGSISPAGGNPADSTTTPSSIPGTPGNTTTPMTPDSTTTPSMTPGNTTMPSSTPGDMTTPSMTPNSTTPSMTPNSTTPSMTPNSTTTTPSSTPSSGSGGVRALW